MGGLASGIYGQANGYKTTIFEQHSLPGGQCASWKRKGYTFDACIHHLYGCADGSGINRLWRETGAMPRELAPTLECASVAAPDGTLFRDYYDLDTLKEHLLELAPEDRHAIDEYVKVMPRFIDPDFFDEAMTGSRLELMKMTPAVPG